MVARMMTPRDEPPASQTLFEVLRKCEVDYLSDLVAQTEGNLSQAARIAGLSRAALRAKLVQHGLRPPPAGETDETAQRPRSRLRLCGGPREV